MTANSTPRLSTDSKLLPPFCKDEPDCQNKYIDQEFRNSRKLHCQQDPVLGMQSLP